MSYTLTIHFTDGDKSYPVMREGFALSDLVGAKGKHATQSLSCQIRSREAALAFLMAEDELIKAELKSASETVFEGVVRPYRSFSARGNREDNLTLEIMDYTEALHIYATESTPFLAKSISEIFTTIYNKADISATLSIPSALETQTIDYCILDKGSYYDEWLAQMLYEYGYDFRFSVGKCEIIPTTAESSDLSITDIRNTFSVSRSDDRNQGIRVKYGKYPSKRMTLVSHSSKEFKNSVSIGNPTARKRMSGFYYNNTMNSEAPTSDYWLKWSPSGISVSDIVAIDDLKYEFYVDQPDFIRIGTQYLSLNGPKNNLEGACVNLQYDMEFFTGLFVGGWQFHILADGLVRYRVDDAEETYTAGDSPTVITAKFITTQANAEALARRENSRLTQASITYTFTSLTYYTAGGFYRLSDQVTGISTLVRILSCEMDADGIFSVKAEGAGAIDTSVETKTLRLVDLSEGNVEFMVLNADKTEVTSGDTCTVSVTGTILDIQSEYGFTYKWYLNGTEISGATGLSVTLTEEDMQTGQNTVRCVSYYNGNEHCQAVININDIAVAETEIEYAIGEDADTPPSDLLAWGEETICWEAS